MKCNLKHAYLYESFHVSDQEGATVARGSQPPPRRSVRGSTAPRAAQSGQRAGQPKQRNPQSGQRAGQSGQRRPATTGRAATSKSAKKQRLIDYPRAGKRGWRRWLPSWRLVLGGVLGVIALGAGVFVAAYVTTPIPAPNDFVTEQTSRVFYSDGETELGAFMAQNREIIDTTKLPEHVTQAVVAAEDRSFYDNVGVDPIGLARAVIGNLTGSSRGGGSTITQQYVKNYYLTSERTMSRKLTEAILAIKIDQQQDKSEILDAYLNTIYFGRGAYGIQTAAHAYFKKDAADLTVSEAALIAGILPSPSNWDPAVSPSDAKRRWAYVLDGMVTQGWLTQAERDRQTFPELPPRAREDRYAGPQGYLLDMVRKEIVQRTGWTEEDLDRGGLRVVTTIEKPRQEAAVAAVKNLPEGHSENLRTALVSIDPKTGGIVALYGGPDFITQPRNAATQDRAQAGSTFKPFTLVAALENGVSLHNRYSGRSPMEFDSFDKPVRNYGNQSFGERDLVGATANSINTIYVQLNEEVGPAATVDAAERAGLPADTVGLAANAANVLGTASPHPIDMARAYSTFAAQGLRTTPHIVSELFNNNGDLVYTASTSSERVFASGVMADTTYALTQVIEKGSGRTARELGRPAAGKTGTSQDHRSAWFAGYVPQLATVVAMYQPGPDGEEPITPWGGVKSITGGTYPTRVWTDYMAAALEGVEVEPFPERADVGKKPVVMVDVPNVVGMPQDEAEEVLTAAGLNIRISREESGDVDAGSVLRSNPGAGAEVAEGTTVEIVVATAPAVIEVRVPELVGLSQADAEARLREAQLRFVFDSEPSEQAPGTVLRVNPGVGELVEPGATIRVVISSGPAQTEEPEPPVDPDPTTPPPDEPEPSGPPTSRPTPTRPGPSPSPPEDE